jgi:hypothetical protein
MAQIIITNLTSGRLALDFKAGSSIIRESLETGGHIDIGTRASLDELNECEAVRDMIAAGTISVTSVPEATDIMQTFDTLTVGDPDSGYTDPNQAWMVIDGTNPPTFAAIRLIDQDDGSIQIITVESGVLTVTPA